MAKLLEYNATLTDREDRNPQLLREADLSSGQRVDVDREGVVSLVGKIVVIAGRRDGKRGVIAFLDSIDDLNRRRKIGHVQAPL